MIDARENFAYTRVILARFDADTVTISKGLKTGDLVVTAGVNSLAEGEKVRLPQDQGK